MCASFQCLHSMNQLHTSAWILLMIFFFSSLIFSHAWSHFKCINAVLNQFIAFAFYTNTKYAICRVDECVHFFVPFKQGAHR